MGEAGSSETSKTVSFNAALCARRLETFTKFLWALEFLYRKSHTFEYKIRNIYEPEKDEVLDSLGNARGNEEKRDKERYNVCCSQSNKNTRMWDGKSMWHVWGS